MMVVCFPWTGTQNGITSESADTAQEKKLPRRVKLTYGHDTRQTRAGRTTGPRFYPAIEIPGPEQGHSQIYPSFFILLY